MRLNPKSKGPNFFQMETGRREIFLTDVTYETIDLELLKKYFPSIYGEEMQGQKLVKRSKGNK